jgi:Neurotransmitter-gated ion-channel transmembrane region
VISVTYLMATMTLGTVSICMTVLILNVHHRGSRCRVPVWLHRLCFEYIARFLCIQTPYRHRTQRPNSVLHPQSSTMVDISTSSTSLLNPAWKRRFSRRQTSRPAVDPNIVWKPQKQSNDSPSTATDVHISAWSAAAARLMTSRSAVNGLKESRSISRHRQQPEITSPSVCRTTMRNDSICNGAGCDYFVIGEASSAITRSNGAVSSTLSCTARPPPCKTTSATRTGQCDEDLNSPLLPKKLASESKNSTALACQQDRGSRDASGWTECRAVGDNGTESDNEEVAKEWREIARVLDRLCFWTLLALMTASGFIILLYPKYTGNETDWEPPD